MEPTDKTPIQPVIEIQIKATKTLRRDLDVHLQILKSIHPSRERSLAIMWLGMDLKRLGPENPYPQSYNPDSAVVEPTADGLKL